jgi:hypothetical protein
LPAAEDIAPIAQMIRTMTVPITLKVLSSLARM